MKAKVEVKDDGGFRLIIRLEPETAAERLQLDGAKDCLKNPLQSITTGISPSSGRLDIALGLGELV